MSTPYRTIFVGCQKGIREVVNLTPLSEEFSSPRNRHWKATEKALSRILRKRDSGRNLFHGFQSLSNWVQSSRQSVSRWCYRFRFHTLFPELLYLPSGSIQGFHCLLYVVISSNLIRMVFENVKIRRRNGDAQHASTWPGHLTPVVAQCHQVAPNVQWC